MYTDTEMIVFMLAAGLGTFITRAIPFVFLRDSKETPKVVLYLGRVLPAACIGLLIIYCLKDVSVIDWPHGIPVAIGILIAGVLHYWKRNAILSIFGSTIAYMVMVQFLFLRG